MRRLLALILTFLATAIPLSFAENSVQTADTLPIASPEPFVLEGFERRTFYPHITSPAQSLEPNEFAFETLSAVSGYTTVASNSISFGFKGGIQLGTSPLLYLSKTHNYNLNGKWAFFDRKFYSIGVGLFLMNIKVENPPLVRENDGTYTSVNHVTFYSVGFLINTYSETFPIDFGMNINLAALETTSAAMNEELRRFNIPIEILVDASYQLDSHWAFTLGVGRNRSFITNLNETRLPFGAGLSITHIPKSFFLSKVRLGYHFIPEAKKHTVLFSFGF